MAILENKDYAILRALIKNSRVSLTRLGKIVHSSRENVSYRLNRLRRLGIVKSTKAIINTGYLGFKQYALFLQLIKINKQKEAEIIKSLKSHKSVSWIGVLVGKWSMALDIYARNEEDLTKSIHEILAICSQHIKDYALLPLEKKEYFLNKLFHSKSNYVKPRPPKPLKLDVIDMRLLKILNTNSQTSYVELSEHFNLTPNALKKRIKRLELKDVILNYSLVINYKLLGFEWYGVQLKLLKFSETVINEIIGYLQQEPKIIFYYKYISGFWNFDLGVFVKEPNEFRLFINELRNKFPEEIQINDFFLLIEEATEHTLPNVIFESAPSFL